MMTLRTAYTIGAHVAGTSISAAMGSGRKRRDVIARQVAWKLLHDAGWSLAEIGRAAGRDHTTIMHGVRRMETSSDYHVRTAMEAATAMATHDDRAVRACASAMAVADGIDQILDRVRILREAITERTVRAVVDDIYRVARDAITVAEEIVTCSR